MNKMGGWCWCQYPGCDIVPGCDTILEFVGCFVRHCYLGGSGLRLTESLQWLRGPYWTEMVTAEHCGESQITEGGEF